jgi:hypothetical protein
LGDSRREANADGMTAGPGNLVVSIVENEKEDWSFGAGRAQFLTGGTVTRLPVLVY